jgi:hypothetical protein
MEKKMDKLMNNVKLEVKKNVKKENNNILKKNVMKKNMVMDDEISVNNKKDENKKLESKCDNLEIKKRRLDCKKEKEEDFKECVIYCEENVEIEKKVEDKCKIE